MLFHFSNLPQTLFGDEGKNYKAIIAGTVGKENTYGTITGRIKPIKATFCRVLTDDLNGQLRAYVGEGEITNEAFSKYLNWQIYYHR